MSPSTRSNDTLSGISSLAPSKHSTSSHSLASVSFLFLFGSVCRFHASPKLLCPSDVCSCVSQALQINLPIHPHHGKPSPWWKSRLQQRKRMQRIFIWWVCIFTVCFLDKIRILTYVFRYLKKAIMEHGRLVFYVDSVDLHLSYEQYNFLKKYI